MTTRVKPYAWLILVFMGMGILLTIVLFYAEENWRGKRDWENCKLELKAKGQTLDWKDYIPPPVPDDQNFFKAPKMTEWFVKSRVVNFTNELVERLRFTGTNSIEIARITVVPPSADFHVVSNKSDLTLRYSEYGHAFFLSGKQIDTNSYNYTPDDCIPQIKFMDVPITTAIENLARIAKIHYALDRKLGYGYPDDSGVIRPEPTTTLEWKNITGRQALLSLLNRFGLQLVEEPKSGVAKITFKDRASPENYVAQDVAEQIEELMQNLIGKNLIGSQGMALLTKPSEDIKPENIIVESEHAPGNKELNALFTEFFPGGRAKLGFPRIHIMSIGTNSIGVYVDVEEAADYLKWSDQFHPEFVKIREALKRPYARMDSSYDNPLSVPLPDYSAIRSISQMLSQRAQCYFLIGNPAKALKELTLLNNMRQVLEAKPSGKLMTLVSTMANVAVSGLYADTIADGFRLHAWREPQLIKLQSQLKTIRLKPFLVEAMKVEPAGICHWGEMAWIKKYGPFICPLAGVPGPKGWAYQNFVALAKTFSQLISSYNPTGDYVFPHVCDETQHKIDDYLKRDSFIKIITVQFKFLVVLIPDLTKAEMTTAHAQVMVNEAEIACALERYHFLHGTYPISLEQLSPQFIKNIPRDIIDGGVLKYKCRDDDDYLLYSIGWNEIDEGGLRTPNSTMQYDVGDWVWQN